MLLCCKPVTELSMASFRNLYCLYHIDAAIVTPPRLHTFCLMDESKFSPHPDSDRYPRARGNSRACLVFASFCECLLFGFHDYFVLTAQSMALYKG